MRSWIRASGMTEPTVSGPERVAAVLLPGAPQIARGGSPLAWVVLGVWLGMLLVVATRFGRLVEAMSGPWDSRLAVFTVVGSLAACVAWSWRSLAAPTGPAEGVSQWGLALRAFLKNRAALFGLGIIVGFYLLALITPVIAPHDPDVQFDLVRERLVSMSAKHPLGTDHLARDVLSRLLYGARISLTIGFVAVAISVSVGTLLGSIAGFFGGIVDTVIMRFVDMMISFPRLILLITIIALFDASIFLIIAILGLTLWPSTARLVRSEVLSLREREFIQAAEALGYPRARIIVRHLIPNALGPVIVAATLGIGNTIVLEAGLSFLGLGVQPPTASWGTMVADGRNELINAWWLATFPGLAIVFTVLAFNVVGDGLRDALDPRLRR